MKNLENNTEQKNKPNILKYTNRKNRKQQTNTENLIT